MPGKFIIAALDESEVDDQRNRVGFGRFDEKFTVDSSHQPCRSPRYIPHSTSPSKSYNLVYILYNTFREISVIFKIVPTGTASKLQNSFLEMSC